MSAYISFLIDFFAYPEPGIRLPTAWSCFNKHCNCSDNCVISCLFSKARFKSVLLMLSMVLQNNGRLTVKDVCKQTSCLCIMLYIDNMNGKSVL